MRTIGELVSERTGEKEKGGKKERERGAVLHHPELARIPSLRTLRRCVSAHQCTWHPSEFSLLSLSLFFSPPLHACLLSLFTSLSLSLPLESRSRPFSPLPFLFLLRLLFEVNPPISYALHQYTGCRGNIRGYR